MKLFGLLNWYDESPTWLAACISSMARIGVDHVIAVDGAYPLYPERKARSHPEQAESIMLTAHGAGIGCTIVRPQDADRHECEKRELLFRLAATVGTPMVDWSVIIDADDLIVEGSPRVKDELAGLDSDIHCAKCHLQWSIDPDAPAGSTRQNTDKTTNIFRKMPVTMTPASTQSRFFRVMHDMRVPTTHYNYVGTDGNGVVWDIRPDYSNALTRDMCERVSECADVSSLVVIEHRDVWRTAYRQLEKKEYYRLRDLSKIEAV